MLETPWRAHAQFQADEHGVVDVDTQPPLAGTYDQADGMGLFWSMKIDPNLPRIGSFRKTTMNPRRSRCGPRSETTPWPLPRSSARCWLPPSIGLSFATTA